MPLGERVRLSHYFADCEISWAEGHIRVILVPIDLSGFDMIVGMDCLSAYRAKVTVLGRKLS